jgi:hypothetical protein
MILVNNAEYFFRTQKAKANGRTKNIVRSFMTGILHRTFVGMSQGGGRRGRGGGRGRRGRRGGGRGGRRRRGRGGGGRGGRGGSCLQQA